jgi:hypothetical protein
MELARGFAECVKIRRTSDHSTTEMLFETERGIHLFRVFITHHFLLFIIPLTPFAVKIMNEFTSWSSGGHSEHWAVTCARTWMLRRENGDITQVRSHNSRAGVAQRLVTSWTADGSCRGKIFLFSTSSRPVLGHPASYPMGTGGSFLGGKAAGTRSWPFTCNYFWRSRIRGSTHPLPIRLHRLVFN